MDGILTVEKKKKKVFLVSRNVYLCFSFERAHLSDNSLVASILVHTELLEKKNLPSLDELMLKRQKEDTFMVFADTFLSRVVGMSIWRKNCAKLPISEMATISDEAFTLLLLENYWEGWSTKNLDEYKSEVTIDETTNQKKKRKATWGKFTSGAWGSRRFGGWSKEGLIRFNQLYSQVEEDRKKDNAAEVEEQYRLRCVNSKSKKRKRASHDNDFNLKIDNLQALLRQ